MIFINMRLFKAKQALARASLLKARELLSLTLSQLAFADTLEGKGG